VVPNERLHPVKLPAVRGEQVGYLPTLAKTATVVTDSTARSTGCWSDAGGKTRASARRSPLEDDKASGEAVHIIDFSTVTTPGKGWKLRVGADRK
jgi:endoglucanase